MLASDPKMVAPSEVRLAYRRMVIACFQRDGWAEDSSV